MDVICARRLQGERIGMVGLLALTLLSGCARSESSQGGTPAASQSAAAAPVTSGPVGSAASAPPAAPTIQRIALPSVSAETQRACREICEHSEALHCRHHEECSSNCLAMASLTPCASEITALQRCLKGHPTAHWECAEDGVAAIKEGYCDAEQGQALACMEAKMQKTP